MLTNTATKQLRKAIKTRLGLNDRQASSIIERNWFLSPVASLQDCVVLVQNAQEVNPSLSIYIPSSSGYYEWAGYLNLEKNDLTRWNAMSLEEAYALPEGFRMLADSLEWRDATVIDCRPRDSLAIIVTVDFGEGLIREMVMLADINDAEGLIEYVREKTGRSSRVCFEEKPSGDRSVQAQGLPIIEMICINEDAINLDEYFGPIPEKNEE